MYCHSKRTSAMDDRESELSRPYRRNDCSLPIVSLRRLAERDRQPDPTSDHHRAAYAIQDIRDPRLGLRFVLQILHRRDITLGRHLLGVVLVVRAHEDSPHDRTATEHERTATGEKKRPD